MHALRSGASSRAPLAQDARRPLLLVPHFSVSYTAVAGMSRSKQRVSISTRVPVTNSNPYPSHRIAATGRQRLLMCQYRVSRFALLLAVADAAHLPTARYLPLLTVLCSSCNGARASEKAKKKTRKQGAGWTRRKTNRNCQQTAPSHCSNQSGSARVQGAGARSSPRAHKAQPH